MISPERAAEEAEKVIAKYALQFGPETALAVRQTWQ